LSGALEVSSLGERLMIGVRRLDWFWFSGRVVVRQTFSRQLKHLWDLLWKPFFRRLFSLPSFSYFFCFFLPSILEARFRFYILKKVPGMMLGRSFSFLCSAQCGTFPSVGSAPSRRGLS